MKSWILLTVIAVALTAIVTVAVPLLSTDSSLRGPEFPAPSKPEGPTPKLVINEDTTYKFDISSQEKKGSHEWTFKNEGAGVLEVRGSSTTCSCTTSDLFEGKDGKTGKLIKLQPGESKQITVNWNTKKFTGTYRQVVTVATNDPDKQTVELVVTGTIKEAFVTMPPDLAVAFMNVPNDEESLRRVMIASPDLPETKILSVTTSNPDLLSGVARELTADEFKRYGDTSKFEKAHWIEVKLKPSPNLGEFAEEVVVTTDHPLKPTLSIRVKGRVTGSISVIPDRIEMGNASVKDGGKQDLTIWSRSRNPVNFSILKKPAGMEVTILPLPPVEGAKGSSYKMTVKLEPGLESGLLADEVVLKTDDPKVTEIHLPVSILVKGSR